MIRVLVVDDSALARKFITDIFQQEPDIEVAGEAADGRQAVELTRLLRPDLVVTDIIMPVMDGLEAIEAIMAETPTPILVFTASLSERDVNLAFEAIRRGALDVMEKPEEFCLREGNGYVQQLIEKVRLLSRIRVIRHRPLRKQAVVPRKLPLVEGERHILAIGASTGGPKAVMSILKQLPADFRGSVLVVQHIARGFTKGFVTWLDRECAIKVKLAEQGDTLRGKEVLVAPNDFHMEVKNGEIQLVDSAPVNCCCPSIDVLFKSLAREQAKQTVAVLLTGMGRDGAVGLRDIKLHGGLAIVQDEESSVVFGMPKAAIALGAADKVLPLATMPAAIMELFE